MTLLVAKDGWINVDLAMEGQTMITQERKSKYKHKVIFTPAVIDDEHCEVREWCEKSFGPGGRSRKLRWRYGWTENTNVYYFKNSKDAMLFTLRWSS